jgi:hypothetical protein
VLDPVQHCQDGHDQTANERNEKDYQKDLHKLDETSGINAISKPNS